MGGSLFIVGRFMTERKLRPSPEDAVVVMHRVMSTSGRTIQFSALTVLVRSAPLLSHNRFPHTSQPLLQRYNQSARCVVIASVISVLVRMPCLPSDGP